MSGNRVSAKRLALYFVGVVAGTLALNVLGTVHDNLVVGSGGADIVASGIVRPSGAYEQDFVDGGGIIVAVVMDGKMPIGFQSDKYWRHLLPRTCSFMRQHSASKVLSNIVFRDRVFPFETEAGDCGG